ncbi:hypothetical protein V8G54_013638 [Vigna mungo]|uniref:Uncharacterized protein n=1 Tax=Vigna mungo TaxID=3915 RepID=A0AAQ3RXW9_VIGMU
MLLIFCFQHSSCEVVDEARSVCHVESPREKRNAAIGVSIDVIRETELAPHPRREALHFLTLRVCIPRVVVHLRRFHHAARSLLRRCGRGTRPSFLLLESNPTRIAQ